MKKNLPYPLQLQVQRKYRVLITPTKKEKQEKSYKKYKGKMATEW